MKCVWMKTKTKTIINAHNKHEWNDNNEYKEGAIMKITTLLYRQSIRVDRQEGPSSLADKSVAVNDRSMIVECSINIPKQSNCCCCVAIMLAIRRFIFHYWTSVKNGKSTLKEMRQSIFFFTLFFILFSWTLQQVQTTTSNQRRSFATIKKLKAKRFGNLKSINLFSMTTKWAAAAFL